MICLTRGGAESHKRPGKREHCHPECGELSGSVSVTEMSSSEDVLSSLRGKVHQKPTRKISHVRFDYIGANRIFLIQS